MGQFVDFSLDSVTVKGDWVLDNLSTIEKELPQISDRKIQAEIGQLDTAGALMLSRLGDSVTGLEEWQQSLLKLVTEAKQDFPDSEPDPSILNQFFITVGKNALTAWHNLLDLVSFIGEVAVRLGQVIVHPKQLRMTSIVRHIHEAGVLAIPIVALIAFLISIVLAYQGAEQLKRFGAEIFTINMVAISVLREMGVLLTAIMIAGRSGSAFTAEIGVMKVNEEVDAMRIIGMTPFEILVIPRLIALMICMPLLTFIADLMGFLGGGIISYVLLDISPGQYLDRCQAAIKAWDFWVGMIKAPVFGFIIAIVGCMRGMQVSGSAESVGRLTTTSVVQSIFLVLLLDALFAVLFTKMGV